MSSILNNKELLTFTFRFIDIIINDIAGNFKFRKKKAFKLAKSFAKYRNLDIKEDVYTFKINDKSFVVSFFDNDVIPAGDVRSSNYFYMDKYFYEDNKLTYLFIPSQDKYYTYDDNSFYNIIYSVLNLFNKLFDIDIYGDNINGVVRSVLNHLMITLILYFTLEDNLDTSREVNNFIMYHYGMYNKYCTINEKIYNDLFEGVTDCSNIHVVKDGIEQIITQNYIKILENILDYIV